MFLAKRISIYCSLYEIAISTLLFWWRDAKRHGYWDHHSDETKESKGPHAILNRKLKGTAAGKRYAKKASWTVPVNSDDFGGSGLGRVYEDLRQLCILRNSSRRNMPLRGVLALCEDRMCQDPRDTIHGTLALADWTRATTWTPKSGTRTMQAHTYNAEMIVPDYLRSPSDVAMDVVPNSIASMTYGLWSPCWG
jgi:hypothetical protein